MSIKNENNMGYRSKPPALKTIIETALKRMDTVKNTVTDVINLIFNMCDNSFKRKK